MRHVLTIAIGVAATLFAIIVTSFFFPRSWQVEQTVRVDAGIQTTFDLVADAREHSEWNPSYADVTLLSADADQLVVAAHVEAEPYQLAIEQRQPPTAVEANTSRSGRSAVRHRWELVADGSGTLVTWSAEPTEKRKFLGRFATVPIKAWMSDEIERALGALKTASERAQIGTP